MVVYDGRLSRAVVTVTSRLQLQQQQQPPHQSQADGLMLTAGRELLVYVERGRIVIWRLPTKAKSGAYSQYMDDNAPANDEHGDVESYLYDDTADHSQRVNLSIDRCKAPGPKINGSLERHACKTIVKHHHHRRRRRLYFRQ